MRARIQIAVDIVLHQRHIVFFRQLQHAVHVRQRGRCARRAMQPRLREEHLGPALFQQALQQGQVVAFLRARHAQQFAAQQPQAKAQVGIARVVDQHRIARMHQPSGNQVQRMAGALRQQDLLGSQRHLVLHQQIAHQLPQRRKALGLAIAADTDLAGGQRAQRTAHAVAKQPVFRQPAATRFAAQPAVLEDAPHVIHRVEIVAAAGRRHLPIVLPAPTHEKAQVRARDEIALRHQSVVSIHHRVHAHPVRMGKLPDRRQLGTRTQRTLFDQATETVHDLLDQGHGRGGIEHEHGRRQSRRTAEHLKDRG